MMVPIKKGTGASHFDYYNVVKWLILGKKSFFVKRTRLTSVFLFQIFLSYILLIIK